MRDLEGELVVEGKIEGERKLLDVSGIRGIER